MTKDADGIVFKGGVVKVDAELASIAENRGEFLDFRFHGLILSVWFRRM